MTTTNTTTSALPEAHAEWRRAHALLESMYAWAIDEQEQIEMCVEARWRAYSTAWTTRS